MKEEYILQNMMTCIGNKRKLLNYIENIIEEIKILLNKDKLVIMDAFIGSSVVSRMLSYHSSKLITNDLEKYSYIMGLCYLKTPNKKDGDKINKLIDEINQKLETNDLKYGIISKTYAPNDTNDIKEGERCFYTKDNAMRIDTIRDYINEIPKKYRDYVMGNLLVKSSIHTNTGGVFKGFYKDKINGKGCWGGSGGNALSRIKGKIILDKIIWNNDNKYIYKGYNEDINILIKKSDICDLDVIYLDPPYNQHPYGSNYFMLNTIIKNEIIDNISKISGIPDDWNRSKYNSNKDIKTTMIDLLDNCLLKSKYVILSYNDEGFIDKKGWDEILCKYKYKKYEILYDTYKASRNLAKRTNKVTELMYLLWM